MYFVAGRCAQHLPEAAVDTKAGLSVSCCLRGDIGDGLGGSIGSGFEIRGLADKCLLVSGE